MANENNNPPRRHGPGPGRGMNPGEKPKDLKSAVVRLLRELGNFKYLILISLILAVFGVVLSIYSPSLLKDLTDTIQKGITLNVENFKMFTPVTEVSNDELIAEKSSYIDANVASAIYDKYIFIDTSEEKIDVIKTSDVLSKEEKDLALQKIGELEALNQKRIENGEENKLDKLVIINEIPYEALKIMMTDVVLSDGTLVTIDQRISYFKGFVDNKDDNIEEIISTNIASTNFSNMENLTPEEQVQVLSVMKELKDAGEEITPQVIYGAIDKLPNSIQEMIKPKMDMNAVKNIAITLSCMYIISAIFTLIQSILLTDVSNKFARKLRSRISTKINKLPLRYFDKHQIGDILSRVTNDVDTIAQNMNQSFATLVTSIIMFLGTLLMMFITNIVMAFTAILSSFIGFIFMGSILKRSQKYFKARQEELGNLNGHIEEIYSGLQIVKAYNGKKVSDKKFDEYNKRVFNANKKSQFLSGLMQPLMHFVGNLGYVSVCVVGALLTMNNKITFGVIVAFMTYVRMFTNPLSQIAQAMTGLQTTAAASERVFEFLDEPEMDNQLDIRKSLEKDEVKGDIEFRNIVFQYDNNDHPTIKGFSAKADAGHKIAIVGPTGAGKTTLVNLLMKFYDLTEGEILIDGISTKELTRENIHSLFTMVLQDTWLFEGTIRENIVYNNRNVSDEELNSIIKTVGLDHFIKTLPKGVDTELSDNDSVSSGQRQLLTIARGMAEHAPFLILDEATSNVDTRTEELVQAAMDKLTVGKTSFIIAHRLSTIKNADLILVINDGNIIEQGTHEELLDKKGFYADLYNSQFLNTNELD